MDLGVRSDPSVRSVPAVRPGVPAARWAPALPGLPVFREPPAAPDCRRHRRCPQVQAVPRCLPGRATRRRPRSPSSRRSRHARRARRSSAGTGPGTPARPPLAAHSGSPRRRRPRVRFRSPTCSLRPCRAVWAHQATTEPERLRSIRPWSDCQVRGRLPPGAPLPGWLRMERFLAAVVQMASGSRRDANLERARTLIERGGGAWRSARRAAGGLRLAGSARRGAGAGRIDPGPDHRGHGGGGAGSEDTSLHGIHPRARAPASGAASTPAVCSVPAGDLLARYRKIHLFDVDLPGRVTVRESEARARGRRDRGRAAPSSARSASRSATTFASRSSTARLVAPAPRCSSCRPPSPSPTGAAHWDVLCRARAIENQCYLLAAEPDRHEPARLRRLRRLADRRSVGHGGRARGRGRGRGAGRDRPRRLAACGASCPA